MSYDHSIQRLFDARHEKCKAEKAVNDLIEQIVEVMLKLEDWKAVGFMDVTADGVTLSSHTNQINLVSAPYLRPVAEAIEHFRKASRQRDAARSALTEEQRQAIGPEPD